MHTICLTDGEASHGDADTKARDTLAALRRRELTAALNELGPLPTPLHTGFPDMALDRYEDEATAVIAGLLSETDARLCLAPWDGDLHSDHEAAGRAARRACRATGTTLWSFPVWTWHWARPDDPGCPGGGPVSCRSPPWRWDARGPLWRASPASSKRAAPESRPCCRPTNWPTTPARSKR